MDARDQERIDDLLVELDGTANFERIGGTATAISVAVGKAAADSLGIPLYRLFETGDGLRVPRPLGNVRGSGAHSLGPAPDMQEHMVIPVGVRTLRQAVETNLKVHRAVGAALEKGDAGFCGGMDDEDAWAANLNDVEALEIIAEVKRDIEDSDGIEIRLGIDIAADRLWDVREGAYRYVREGVVRRPDEQLSFVGEIIERFALTYVEDAFHSSDYDSFSRLHDRYGARCLICADDIYATNMQRTQEGIRRRSAAAMIIKPNQVGTVTGARRTSALANENGLSTIISNRSGETPDTSIAHFGTAWRARGIKAGVRGGARIIKLNELIRIESEVEGIGLAKVAAVGPFLNRRSVAVPVSRRRASSTC